MNYIWRRVFTIIIIIMMYFVSTDLVQLNQKWDEKYRNRQNVTNDLQSIMHDQCTPNRKALFKQKIPVYSRIQLERCMNIHNKFQFCFLNFNFKSSFFLSHVAAVSVSTYTHTRTWIRKLYFGKRKIENGIWIDSKSLWTMNRLKSVEKYTFSFSPADSVSASLCIFANFIIKLICCTIHIQMENSWWCMCLLVFRKNEYMEPLTSIIIMPPPFWILMNSRTNNFSNRL